MRRYLLPFCVLFVAAGALSAGSTLSFDKNESGGIQVDSAPVVSHPRGKLVFKVSSLTGIAQYQAPLAAEWRKVRKNQNLREGVLLQVSKNTELSLDAEDSLGREGLPVKKTRITINAPTIVRLSRESFRRVQMSEQMVRALPDIESLKKLEFLTKQMKSMKDAWKQDASMLLGKDWVDKNTIKLMSKALESTMQKDPVSMTASIGKINLTAPHDKQITITKDLPTDINLKWERSDAKDPDISNYLIYFWKKGDPRKVFGTAKGNQYTVKVQEAGTYFAQISSVDGGYHSDIKSVKVEVEKKEGKKKSDKPDELASEDPVSDAVASRIKALAPDKNLVLYGKGNWPTIGFEWSKPNKCSKQARYRFTVRDEAKKNVFEVETDKTTFSWSPDKSLSGNLIWFVKVRACMGDGNKIIAMSPTSTPRRLRLMRGESMNSVMSLIAQPKFHGTVLLDEL